MSNVEQPNEGEYWDPRQTYPDQSEHYAEGAFPPPPPAAAYPHGQTAQPQAQSQHAGYAQPAAPPQSQQPGYEQPFGQQSVQGQYPGLPQPPVYPQSQGQYPVPGHPHVQEQSQYSHQPTQGQYPGLPQPPTQSPTQGQYPVSGQPPVAPQHTVPLPGGPSMPGVQGGPGVPGGFAQPSPAPLSSGPKPDTGKALGMAIANLWKIQVDVWGGKTERAFERPEEVRAATGVTWVNWVVPVAALVLSTGLMGLAMLWSMLRQIVAAFADFFGEFGVSTGQLISELGVGPGLFFKFLLLAGLAALALGMALYLAAMLASRVGGQPVSFAAAAEGLAVGNTLLWVPYAASIPVFLIFPYDWALMIVVTLGSGVGIMAIVLNFRSVERNGPYQRDPLVAYACFTTLAYVVFTGVLMIGVLTTSELQQSYVW